MAAGWEGWSEQNVTTKHESNYIDITKVGYLTLFNGVSKG